MYIMCVCLFSALSRRVGALQLSIIIIINDSISIDFVTRPYYLVQILSLFDCMRCWPASRVVCQ